MVFFFFVSLAVGASRVLFFNFGLFGVLFDGGMFPFLQPGKALWVHDQGHQLKQVTKATKFSGTESHRTREEGSLFPEKWPNGPAELCPQVTKSSQGGDRTHPLGLSSSCGTGCISHQLSMAVAGGQG